MLTTARPPPAPGTTPLRPSKPRTTPPGCASSPAATSSSRRPTAPSTCAGTRTSTPSRWEWTRSTRQPIAPGAWPLHLVTHADSPAAQSQHAAPVSHAECVCACMIRNHQCRIPAGPSVPQLAAGFSGRPGRGRQPGRIRGGDRREDPKDRSHAGSTAPQMRGGGQGEGHGNRDRASLSHCACQPSPRPKAPACACAMPGLLSRPRRACCPALTPSP